MPIPICPRKDSEQELILRGIKCQTAPSSHVRKINSRHGILIILPSQYFMNIQCTFRISVSWVWYISFLFDSFTHFIKYGYFSSVSLNFFLYLSLSFGLIKLVLFMGFGYCSYYCSNRIYYSLSRRKACCKVMEILCGMVCQLNLH